MKYKEQFLSKGRDELVVSLKLNDFRGLLNHIQVQLEKISPQEAEVQQRDRIMAKKDHIILVGSSTSEEMFETLQKHKQKLVTLGFYSQELEPTQNLLITHKHSMPQDPDLYLVPEVQQLSSTKQNFRRVYLMKLLLSDKSPHAQTMESI